MPGLDSKVELLLHMDGADTSTTFTDVSKNVLTVTAFGNAQVSTAQSKFGGASLLLDGTGDYIAATDNAGFDVGSGDFTIDLWARFISHPAASNALFAQSDGVDANTGISIDMFNVSRLYVQAGGAVNGSAWASFVPVNDTWYHIEVARSGSTIYIFVDGVSLSVTIDTAFGTVPNSTATAKIGSYQGTTGFVNGYIDEFRFTKGLARHTAGFTPPTEEYTSSVDASPVTGSYSVVNPIISSSTETNFYASPILLNSSVFPVKLTYVHATTFNVELRDKNGLLKKYLTPFVSSVDWEWNRIGGCGICDIELKKEYRDITFDARDDIQIRIKYGSTSKLVYRGYISNAIPTLTTNQTIKIQVKGYFDLFKNLIVHNAGNIKTYTSTLTSAIVDNIFDTFVTPNSSIKKGTIDTGSFTPDTIQFLSTVENALNILSDLEGDIEYGVDENLIFFWKVESTSIRHKFFIGDNVEMFERKINYDNLVNRAYLVGGTVSGSKYRRTSENTDSQSSYFLSEKIINNGSVITDTVADQYLGSILKQGSSPQLNIRAKIVNTNLRLEDTIPIGLITFYDVDYDRNLITDDIGDIIGETVDGGSNITIGLLVDGGSDVIIGGQFADQIDRIQYSLSETNDRMNLTIQFGDSILETASLIKRLQLSLSSLQQF